MQRGYSRRDFLATCLAAAALPAKFVKPSLEGGGRRVFDAISGRPLAGVRVKLKRVGGRGLWRFTTDAQGRYDFDSVALTLSEPAVFRSRLYMDGGEYLDFVGCLAVHPLIDLNEGVGDFGLVPLLHPAQSLGVDDAEFNERWLSLLRDVFFPLDNESGDPPKGASAGALRRFLPGPLLLRLDEALDDSETAFVRKVLGDAVRKLSGGTNRFKSEQVIGSEYCFIPEEDLPAGTITVAKRLDYPRPAARLRFGASHDNRSQSDSAPTTGNNPNGILAALIVLDNLTLVELFDDGLGSADRQRYAASLLQRCLAYCLGWRPTLLLPNRTVVDDNYGPPGAFPRSLFTIEDRALALAASGGGSGCYGPGVRFSARSGTQLVADERFPLNSSILEQP